MHKKNLVTCVEVLHLLSNHTPRFLTHKAGSMSYSPKVIQHAVLIYCLLSCSSGITFWSSFIMNASFNIQFLKLPMHLFKTLMGVFLSLWSAESSFTLATELKYIHKKKITSIHVVIPLWAGTEFPDTFVLWPAEISTVGVDL